MSSSKIYQIVVLASGLFVVTSLCGCRASQANRPALFQQPVVANPQDLGRQLGQRAGNIAVNRLINEGITRVIGGL